MDLYIYIYKCCTRKKVLQGKSGFPTGASSLDFGSHLQGSHTGVPGFRGPFNPLATQSELAGTCMHGCSPVLPKWAFWCFSQVMLNGDLLRIAVGGFWIAVVLGLLLGCKRNQQELSPLASLPEWIAHKMIDLFRLLRRSNMESE